MTRDEAIAEAKARWGQDAVATYNWQMTLNHEVASRPTEPRIFGVGSTWEEAFKDAEERLHTRRKIR